MLKTEEVSRTTLIIGMKYDKGIVLIGDTKIVKLGSKDYHENKITAPLTGNRVAFGSAGVTDLSKEFNRKISQLVTQRVTEYRHLNMKALNGTGINIDDIIQGKTKEQLTFNYSDDSFLDDCAFLTKNIADTARHLSSNPLEVIVVVNVIKPLLFQIDCNGFKREAKYVSIGSGTDHTLKFLEKNYKEDITLKKAILLGTLLIRYVQDLEINLYVGIEKNNLPQIFKIEGDYFGDYNLDEKDKEEILKNVEKRIRDIKNSIIIF